MELDPVSDSQAQPPHIVILDDDAKLRLLVCEYLEAHGLLVSMVGSGAELSRLLERASIDVVILDVMMPGEDGLSVLKRLAGRADPPAVLMLSAMASDLDRILGLELGADDYIAKPVHPRELLARVRAVLRRRRGDNARSAVPAHMLEVSGWTINHDDQSVTAPDGTRIALGSSEYRLLFALVSRAGRIVSRDILLDEAYGGASEHFDRAIDVIVSRLRRRLGPHGGNELIRTVRGEGYRFVRTP